LQFELSHPGTKAEFTGDPAGREFGRVFVVAMNPKSYANKKILFVLSPKRQELILQVG
jgi:hypothetical protein